ncbi:membrane-flanked domain-containing protein [Natronococcus amylolyticus DSM 10524]|uniref:Membrane-flanked domain-containing protein n=1 Tax=Natronococcus amylolyticus DSM 10524 TaxID=1227497 RepID=L9X330_9EURY|nr:PH domain-containing protein [Natronococcus amylolyticus]ELY56179.1 membrane-flanked domain-containing protein [Natronococcus amylolyticus DSM 10524]
MEETHESYDDLAAADWLHLTDDEQVQWAGRPSWLTIAASVAFGIGLAVLGIVLTVWLSGVITGETVPSWVAYLPLALVLAGAGQVGATYLNWIRLLYVITDEEIYVKHGLISRDVTQVRLDRVQNTAYNQSALERALSFGDVVVYTAGTSTDDVTFRSVPNPERVKRTLTHLLSESRTTQPSDGL